MSDPSRPLSPHLSAYKWRITSTLSILHRASGVFLSLSAVLLVAWLLALATGPEAYLCLSAFLASAFGKLLLMFISAAFFYHLLNGIRHLFWDAGLGFELQTARRSGWFVVLASAALTALLWLQLGL